MNRQKWLLVVSVLLVIGAMTIGLKRSRASQRLGRPGVKLIEAKVFDVNTNVIGSNTVPLPERVLEYQSRILPITRTEVEWLPKDTTFARRLFEASNAPPVLLNVILMGTDRGSIHQPQICLTGQGWQIEKSELTTVPMTRPHPYDLPVMKITAGKRGKMADGREVYLQSLYVYWFVADGQLTAKHGERMWWMARDLIAEGVLQRWAYISCWEQFQPGQETAAFDNLKRFIAVAVPDFQLPAGTPSR